VEARFDRYGVRVPALLISPWTGREVCKTIFDHTSVLKYLTNKWNLAPLGNRVASANSISIALKDTMRPPDSYPARINVVTPPTLLGPTRMVVPVAVNLNQQGLVNYVQALTEYDTIKNGATVYEA